MKREVVVFISSVVLTAVLVGAAIAAMPPKVQKFGAGLALLLLIVPLVMAYICQRMSGAAGGPFRGLGWGTGTWWFLAWLGGVVCGVLVVVVSLGLGFMGIDPDMANYISIAEKSSGQQMPSKAMGFLHIMGMITAFAGPTIGAVFAAFFGALGTLPMYGWLGRRLLAINRSTAIMTIAILAFIGGAAAGVADNPAFGDLSMPLRCALFGLVSFSSTFASFWLFLRTRSAIIPALAAGAFQGVGQAMVVYGSEPNMLFAPPAGLIVSGVALLAGIALWVIKDPGGKDMAISDVGFDGTPLSAAPPAWASAAPGSAPMQVPPPDLSGSVAPPPPSPAAPAPASQDESPSATIVDDGGPPAQT